MIKKTLLSFLIIIFTQVSFAATTKKADDKMVAKVNNKPIYESGVRDKLQKFLEFNGLTNDGKFSYDKLNQEMKEDIIKNIIIGDLITEKAKLAKIDQGEEYKNTLKFTKTQLMQKFFLDQLIKTAVTEDKLKARYEEIIVEQSDVEEYKVSHILVSTEEEAQEIEKKLKKGADFSKLAKEFSLDGNKDKGGELDYFTKGQMVPAFEEAVVKLKVGEVSGIIKTDFGYHIIKLLDKRKAKVETFEELKGKISDELAAKFIQEYIEKLKEENKVEFF